MNLDAMTITELEAVSQPGLKLYARTKARAMKARAKGSIAQALLLEARCDEIYKRMPKDLKW
jgi:hypothetical protein